MALPYSLSFSTSQAFRSTNHIMETIALATIFTPLLGGALVFFTPQRLAKWVALVVSFLATAWVSLLFYVFSLSNGQAHTLTLLQIGQAEIFGILVDKVSVLIAFAVVLLGFLVVLYSTAYMTQGNREHPHDGRPRYYAFLTLFIGAMSGLVFSSTLIGQLVFFEVTGACSWALIGYYEKPKALKSALKALVITHIASIGLYFAAAYLFSVTGTFSLSALKDVNDTGKIIIFLGIMIAAWGKSAQIPLHMWLPGAMEAPTPVSAYLHAASMVKVGVYIFARAILSAGNVPEIIGWIGIVMALITMFYSFMMYLPQKDMKRLLAYSTISQLSIIFMALSLSIFGSDLAFNGGVAHIFNHAFGKSLFFLVAGALSYTCGTRVMPALHGLLKGAPMLGICLGVATLAITGVPPFNGFFSKFAIFAAGYEVSREHYWLLPFVILAIVESLLSFAWLLNCFGKTALGAPSEAVAKAQPLPLAMKVTFAVLIVMCLCSSFIASSWLA